MFRQILILAGVFFLWGEARAQEQIVVREGDTLRYSYTPIAQNDPLLTGSKPRKKGFLRRVAEYYEKANVDQTFEKKMDFTFAGGLGYSKNTHVTFAVMAVGLYRVDRTDSVTPPSDLTIFANASVIGFYGFGVRGNTFLNRNRHRIGYTADFVSSPRDMWGVGYEAGRHNPECAYIEKSYRLGLTYLYRVLPSTYVGATLNFNHTRGRSFDHMEYIGEERCQYTATGIGAVLEYDTRDAAMAPQRGIYLSLRETFFAKGLGSCPRSIWRTNLTADFFQSLWSGAVLATDLYAEFNSEGTPWTMLARMGGSFRMRGYYEGRYTDRDMITLQVELRQRIWRRIGCTVWAGGGNVFPSLSRFDWSKTLPNYGIGLRWELKKRMNVRMDYGFGKDTNGFMLNINEAF